MRYTTIAILIALSCIGCNEPYRTTTDTSGKPVNVNTTTDRDNATVNNRDRDSATKTPLDQTENKVDIGITADIRKRVVDTKMSVNAQNVKIIAQDGKVTLRGPVKTEDEKKQIEVIARSVAGENNVDSQLEVEQTP
jgi:hyperosmotically inducible periplasmic protein